MKIGEIIEENRKNSPIQNLPVNVQQWGTCSYFFYSDFKKNSELKRKYKTFWISKGYLWSIHCNYIA